MPKITNSRQIPVNQTAGPKLLPVLLLLFVGSMIGVSVNLSKLVADAGAPVLWLLSLASGGAGLVILALAAAMGQMRGKLLRSLRYALIAGAFLAVPSGLSFLAVAHVGAGFLSLVYAFPVLATYVLALGLGMERPNTTRIFAVAFGLAGGLVLAAAKFQTVTAGAWLVVAMLIPLFLAAGNIYRTRFWPTGAAPTLLAGLTLILSGLLLGILASVIEGASVRLLWQRADLAILLLANLAVFTIQFIFYFLLQRIAGPTYLSQIGGVGAAVGVSIAFVAFGETPPANFPLALGLVVFGMVLFQRSAPRSGTPP